MSSRITAADFPPSSSVQRAIRSPHNDAMRRPAAVEPVNVILSTPGLRDEQLRHFAVGRHDVEHAGWQTDLLRDLGEHVALARRFGRRLEHDGAAGEERGADLVADERDRRVPRDDRADDTDRLAHEQSVLAAAGRRALLLERERVGERRVRVERAGTDAPRVLRDLVERSCLSRPQLGRARRLCSSRPAPSARMYSARSRVGEARPRAFVERLPRGRDCPRHVVGRGFRDRVVHLFVGGIDHVDGRVRRGRDPLTADEEPIRVRNNCGS